MKKLFELASGSIVGTDHRKPLVWKNNQDAFTVRHYDNLTVAVVADGCGQGSYSELGARLAANMLAHRLTQIFGSDQLDSLTIPASLEDLRVSMISRFSEILGEMDPASRTKTVIDNFLFTLLAFVITPTVTCVIGIGDGVYAINGEIFRLGPFENNEPPYLAYGGLVSSRIPAEQCRFVPHQVVQTTLVDSILIGTDGAGDILSIQDKTLPGRKEAVGPLSQFWENGLFFRNSEGIRRRLNQINNSVLRPNWNEQDLNEDHGRLKDDTTLVVARRCAVV